MIKLDLIIPVYNENEKIVELLKLLEKDLTCNFRILICYDNENDKTLEHSSPEGLEVSNNLVVNELETSNLEESIEDPGVEFGDLRDND